MSRFPPPHAANRANYLSSRLGLGTESTSARAQALSVPPYIFAFFVILITAWLSDRFQSRSVPLFILCGMNAFGYSLLALAGLLHKTLTKLSSDISDVEAPSSWWEDRISSSAFATSHSSTVAISYLGVVLAAGTIFAIVSLIITWNGNNSESESGRGTGMAILQAVGQCGPLLGTRLYPQNQGPEVRCALSNPILGFPLLISVSTSLGV